MGGRWFSLGSLFVFVTVVAVIVAVVRLISVCLPGCGVAAVAVLPGTITLLALAVLGSDS